jgi:7-cyano-7-deazaguanine synthase
MTPAPRAVVLVSGGLDSATTLAMAQRDGFECHALSFRYGQRHVAELAAAAAVCRRAGITEHKVIELDLRVFGGSALTADIPVPKGRAEQAMTAEIPVTYVPARNTIFLGFALAWAEVLEARDIFIGVNALDYSGYPDCRPAFIAQFERLANVATRAGLEGATPFRLHAPLIEMSKAQIIAAGLALGVDYGLTRSCYDPAPDGAGCGACDSCLLRLRGFRENGVSDPAPYVHQERAP